MILFYNIFREWRGIPQKMSEGEYKPLKENWSQQMVTRLLRRIRGKLGKGVKNE